MLTVNHTLANANVGMSLSSCGGCGRGCGWQFATNLFDGVTEI